MISKFLHRHDRPGSRRSKSGDLAAVKNCHHVLPRFDGGSIAGTARRGRRHVYLPTRLLSQSFLPVHLDLIAIADCERKTSAHTLLTPQRATELLQDIEQFPPEHRIIHLIRRYAHRLFKIWLSGGMEHRGMIDPLRPAGELRRIVADGEFECLKWTLGYVSRVRRFKSSSR